MTPEQNALRILHAVGQNEGGRFTTHELRENFLIETLFEPDAVRATYTHYDRVVVGGILPVHAPVYLPTYDNLKTPHFLDRREAGVINVGGSGTVSVDGEPYELMKLDCLYLGRGSREVLFTSADPSEPARFFLLSAPAHASYPTRKAGRETANPIRLGSRETANERTIYQYIHAGGLPSCQLVMGLTVLELGSVWNTMPAHVHDRRMEAYCYFDLPPDHRVFHLMGQPGETRHLVVANEQAVLSPPWSIHSGCGTTNYSFIWGMAGENMAFADMDAVPIAALR